MKREKKAPQKLPAWLTDPRLELPLLILVICLSLFLAGLILVPSIRFPNMFFPRIRRSASPFDNWSNYTICVPQTTTFLSVR